MLKIKSDIIEILLMIVVVLGLASFIEWEINPGKWELVSRITSSFIILVLLMLWYKTKYLIK